MSEMKSLGEAMPEIRAKWIKSGYMKDVRGSEADLVPQIDGPACDICHGHRRVRYANLEVGDPNFGRSLTCPALACRAYLAEQRAALLPAAFRHWTLETFMERANAFPQYHDAYENLVAELYRWIAEEDPEMNWLYIWSHEPGRAKTGLSISLMKIIDPLGIFKVAQDVLDEVRQSFHDYDSYRSEGEPVTYGMKTAELLVLDDFGSEYHKQRGDASDWATASVLSPLVVSRHRERKRTIITSNCDLDELTGILGHSRVATRIRERCGRGEWVISMEGFPSMRDDWETKKR